MPFGKIVLNVEPPTKQAVSTSYGPVYEALQELEPGKWLAIPIMHDKESRVREIANVRRAVQRYFDLEEVKVAFGYSSRVVTANDNESIMYVQKVLSEGEDGRQ